jgi:hypothetical protein
MTFTASQRDLIDEAARAAARSAIRELLLAIPQIVEEALQEGREPVLELLEGVASAQVSAAGNYAATLKSELTAARKKNGRRADRS